MDKWKDVELEKMKVGGNKKAKNYLAAQADWSDGANISAKYNSKAAALYRDKITTEAKGQAWSEEESSARNYKSSYIGSSSGGGNTSSYSSNGNFSSNSTYSSNSNSGAGGYSRSNGGSTMSHSPSVFSEDPWLRYL